MHNIKVALLIWASLKVVRGDEFFSFNEEDFEAGDEEEEELDEEVEFPGGGSREDTPTTLSIPREPFLIKVFDEAKQLWRDPMHEEEHASEEKKQMHMSWQQAVTLDIDEAVRDLPGDHTSRRIAAGHIYDFFSKFVNPTDEPLTAEEEDLLVLRVSEMRKREGLLDDKVMLYFGFLTRGSPLQALRSLQKELRALRATRGDRELAEEIARNRERPLLVRQQAEREAAEARARVERETAELALADKVDKENRASMRERLAARASERMRSAEVAERARQTQLQLQQEAAAAAQQEFLFAGSPEEAEAVAELLAAEAGAAAEAAAAAVKEKAVAEAAETRAAASRAAALEAEELSKIAARKAWEAEQQQQQDNLAAESAAAEAAAQAELDAAAAAHAEAGLASAAAEGDSWDADWEDIE